MCLCMNKLYSHACSYFLQGAVDIYNCGYPTITNCTFQNNGPTYIIKTQRYRGHSGGLSVGYNYDSVIGYNPLVLVSNSTFINNSVMTRLTTDTQVLQNRIFTGRGGGASIIINAADSVFALVEDCYFGENSALTLGGGLYTIPDGLSNHTIIVNRTKFINNRSLGGGGGLQQVYINPGSLSRLLSVLTYNCDFIGNTATVGGAIYQFLTGEAFCLNVSYHFLFRIYLSRVITNYLSTYTTSLNRSQLHVHHFLHCSVHNTLLMHNSDLNQP